MRKIVLITGASSGIGKATALLLAQNGFDIIMTGRRMERLNETAGYLLKNQGTKVKILNFDIRNRDEVEKAMENLGTEWRNIDVLVNNAGLAVGLNHINDGDVDDWERMIDTNIKGLLYITRIVSRNMVENGKGHIVNISSVAGKEAYENGNVYCATKHAVDALSRAMRIDLVSHGIKVTNIAPGMVDTEFSTVRFKGDRERADKVYSGLTPLFAEDIAEAVLFAVTRPEHVNINDLLIMPTAQAAATITHRNLNK